MGPRIIVIIFLARKSTRHKTNEQVKKSGVQELQKGDDTLRISLRSVDQ